MAEHDAGQDRAPVLEARGVVKRFKQRHGQGKTLTAVAGVDFIVREGEVVGLVGESGSGKTTLGRCLLRLTEIDEGSIALDGVDLHGLSAKALRQLRGRFQMIFQNPHASLNPGMRVGQTLRETLRLHRGLKGQSAEGVVDEILRTVSLGDKKDAFPHELSGGQKRRVGLAKVLLLSPRLVIADEPTAGLDASLKAGVLRLMLETRAAEMAYVIITHDLHLIRSVADRILVMFRGHLVEEVPQGAFELGWPHHPYTELLLGSFFLGGGRKVPVAPPPPTPVDVEALSPRGGCCYYDYCVRARSLGKNADICQREVPRLEGRGVPGRIACHFA